MRMLKEKYKTYEGARKRAAFENGVARSEFEHGLKAKHYRYCIVAECDGWRVAREPAERSDLRDYLFNDGPDGYLDDMRTMANIRNGA